MATITLDMETLTLGEIVAAEDASGKDISRLLATSGNRRMLAVFVQGLRSSGRPPDWQEIAGLRILDVSSGPSPSPPDNPSATSNGSS